MKKRGNGKKKKRIRKELELKKEKINK